MKPSKLTVFELFEKERRYVLPVFQRPYVWNEEEQWAPLWEDVEELADRVYRYGAAERGGEADQPPTHFLGAVVLEQLRTYGRQVAASDVVDGQQRITTLQVLLAAMRDVATSQAAAGAADDALAADFKRLLENTCRMEDAFEQHKVWPTMSDREAFAAMVTAGSRTEVERRLPVPPRRPYQRRDDPRHRLAEAYLYFFNRVHAYLTGNDDSEHEVGLPLAVSLPEGVGTGDGAAEPVHSAYHVASAEETGRRLDALLDAVTRYMELVVIELEDDDDPQVIFESLNGRGAPLLPSDLIRNFVFLEAAGRRTPEEVEVLYEAHWARYDGGAEGAFWKEEVSQGRLKRPRIDLFLFHYITARTARDTRITHLYQEFRQWWQRNAGEVADELQLLGRYADAFRELVDPPDDGRRYHTFARRLRLLETSTVYPILLHLAVERGYSDDALDHVSVALESFLVRRWVCGLTSKSYNRLFLRLLEQLRENDDPHPADIEALLARGEGESSRWPTDAELERAVVWQPVYKRHQGRTRMVLEALDRALLTSRHEGLALPNGLTIEHLLPQQGNIADWPYPEGEAEGTLEAFGGDAEARRAALLHTLGNLTLLTQPLNSSVSNGPFRKKRPAITAQSQLPLNTYFQAFGDEDRWAEPEILARADTLYERARAVWPRRSEDDQGDSPLSVGPSEAIS